MDLYEKAIIMAIKEDEELFIMLQRKLDGNINTQVEYLASALKGVLSGKSFTETHTQQERLVQLLELRVILDTTYDTENDG
jgi:hypothetical protein